MRRKNFASNRFIFLFYNERDGGGLYSTVSRYTLTPDFLSLDSSSFKRIFRIQRQSDFHAGGGIAFGAHVGGFVAGLVLCYLFICKPCEVNANEYPTETPWASRQNKWPYRIG